MTQVMLAKSIRSAVFGLTLVFVLVTTAVGLETAVSHTRTTLASDAPFSGPNIAIEKTPDTQEIAQGGTANFTITVTNTGSIDLENVTVDDPLAPDCDHTIGSLTVGSGADYSCQLTTVTQSFLNTATVTASAVGTGAETTDSDSAFVKVGNPNIKIVKSPDVQTILKGDTALFSIIVLNTSGSVDLKDVQVFDPLTPSCNKTIGNLAAGASHNYSCQKTGVTSAFANIASVIGTNVNNNNQVNDSDAAIVEVLELAVSYSVNPASLPEPGGLGTYTVQVTNNSSVDVDLNGLVSNDYGNLFSASNSNVQNNTCAAPSADLPATGGVYTCTFEVIFDSQPTILSDTVTATAAANSVTVNANDGATITITDVPPDITVSVTADPGLIQTPGGDIDFTVRVDNNSSAESVTLDSLSDTLLGDLDGEGDCSLPIAIQADSFYQCMYTAAVTGSPGTVTITVTAMGSDDDGGSDSDSDQVDVLITAKPITFQFLPVVLNNYVISEPNDTCDEAYGISVNNTFNFLPDDDEDWYWFDLPTSGDISIQLTEFQPIAGQIIAYFSTSGTCSTLQFLKHNGDFSTIKIINLSAQPAGRYYIRIITDGPKSNTVTYKLYIQAP